MEAYLKRPKFSSKALRICTEFVNITPASNTVICACFHTVADDTGFSKSSNSILLISPASVIMVAWVK